MTVAAYVTTGVHLPHQDGDDGPVTIRTARLDADTWTLNIGVECTIFVHTIDQARALMAACSKMATAMVNDHDADESVRVIR